MQEKARQLAVRSKKKTEELKDTPSYLDKNGDPLTENLGSHVDLSDISQELVPFRGANVIQNLIFKVIVIGNSAVGKSCLINRATKNEFKYDHEVTLGVEFGSMMLKINDEHLIKLQIWDTAG